MNKVFAIDKDERLQQLVASTEAGEQLELTVGGKVVAKVVPERTTIDSSGAEAAMKRIADRAKKMTLGGISIKELVDEGRRS